MGGGGLRHLSLLEFMQWKYMLCPNPDPDYDPGPTNDLSRVRECLVGLAPTDYRRGLPLIQPPLGPEPPLGPIGVSWLEGWPHFMGEVVFCIVGTFQSVLTTGVATFQGSRLEGVHCIHTPPGIGMHFMSVYT